MKIQVSIRETKYTEGYQASVVNINKYIEHITGKKVAKHEHHMRYDFGDSPAEAVENLLTRLRDEDGFTGTWIEV